VHKTDLFFININLYLINSCIDCFSAPFLQYYWEIIATNDKGLQAVKVAQRHRFLSLILINCWMHSQRQNNSSIKKKKKCYWNSYKTRLFFIILLLFLTFSPTYHNLYSYNRFCITSTSITNHNHFHQFFCATFYLF
jgi:hypothetical protein